MNDPPTLPEASEPEASQTQPSVQLSGWRLRLAWAGLAAYVLWGIGLNVRAVPVYLAVYEWGEPAFQALHINAYWISGAEVEPSAGGVAEQAGMPVGRLIAIGGRPLPDGASFLDVAALVRDTPADTVALRVVAHDGGSGEAGDTVAVAVPRTDITPPEFAAMPLSYAAFETTRLGIALVGCLGFLLAGILLVLRQGRSFIALIGAAAFVGWGLQTPFWEVAVEVQRDLWGPVFRYVGFFLLVTFLMRFPSGRVRPRWAWGALVLMLGVLVVHWSSWAMTITEGLLPFRASWVGSLSGPAGLLLFSGTLGVLAAAQGVRYRRQPPGVERQQSKWGMLGFIGGVSFVVAATAVVLWASEGTDAMGVNMLGLLANVLWLGVLCMPAGVVVSLTRYRLWGAEAAWSRSAMAGALTLALTAIIAGGTAITQSAFGASGPLALGVATVAAAVVFVPLQRRLDDWADHRFLRDLTELKATLPGLVNHLRETESVGGIAEAVTDRVAPVVHATHAALVVPHGDGWQTVGAEGILPARVDAWAATAGLSDPPAMAPTRRQPWRAVVWSQSTDRQFPVRVALRSERAGGRVAVEGWLGLGPRPDGSGYGSDDLEAVAEIAGPVGRALQVVHTREVREAERTAAFAAMLDEAIARLRSDLHAPPSP